MKKIFLIAMGGTISTTGTAGSLLPSLQGEEILRRSEVAEWLVSRDIATEVINFTKVNSPNLMPQQIVDLAALLNERLPEEDVLGAVITHGTSTMEETAFLLDILVDAKKPVTMTGSMRSSSSPWADGPSNLHDSIRVLADPACPPNVLLVFNGLIHFGRYIHKANSSNLSPFTSQDQGLAGDIYEDHIRWFSRALITRHVAFSGTLTASAAIIPYYMGADGRYIDYAAASGEKGIVVEGVGLGNLNAAYHDAIRRAVAQGLTVVDTTRCDCGPVMPVYANKGGAATIKESGAYLSSLSSAKARLILLLHFNGAIRQDELEEWLG